VATYNLYLGADLSLVLGDRTAEELPANFAEVQRQLETARFSRRAPALAQLLARDRPDLVGLQESCIWTAGDRVVSDYTVELLAALAAAGEAYEVVSSQPTFTGTGRLPLDDRTLRLEGSNVIVRRQDSAVRVVGSGSGLFGDALTMSYDAGEVSIARGWCDVECTLDGRPGSGLRFVDTHTEAYEAGARNRQRDELLALLDATDRPLVVVGDFNAVPGDVGMPESFQDAWTAAGNASEGPAAWTCCQAADLSGDPSGLDQRIDYVWVRGLDVLGSHRVGAERDDRTPDRLWPSDHAGVVADLVLP
jgi:hypothetical protein